MARTAIANETIHVANPDNPRSPWSFDKDEQVSSDHPAVDLYPWIFDLADIDPKPAPKKRQRRTRADTPDEPQTR